MRLFSGIKQKVIRAISILTDAMTRMTCLSLNWKATLKRYEELKHQIANYVL